MPMSRQLMQMEPDDLSGEEQEEDEEGVEDLTIERERRDRVRIGSGSGSGTGTWTGSGSEEELDVEADERELEAGGGGARSSVRPASRASRSHTPRFTPERALDGCVFCVFRSTKPIVLVSIRCFG